MFGLLDLKKPVFAAMLLIAGSAFAGNPSTSYEEILGDVEDENSYLQVLSLLDVTARQPVNLLVADEEEIASLPWISPQVASEIVSLRSKGELHCFADLRKIKELSPRTIALLSPFVIFEKPKKAKPAISPAARMRLSANLPLENRNQVKTYLRGEIDGRFFTTGFTLEKDSGEKSLNDFQSYHITLNHSGTNVILGDFLLVSGHGLVFGGPYGYSPSFVAPWRYTSSTARLKPYTSTQENLMLRGLAFSRSLHMGKVCIVASSAKVDARLDENGNITSFPISGNHTSQSDLTAKDAVRENLLGAVIQLERSKFRLQGNLSLAHYDHDFAPAWSGKVSRTNHIMGGIDFAYGTRSNSFFGEFATSGTGKKAYLGGLLVRGKTTEAFAIARHYENGFFNRHQGSFAYYSNIGDGETGLFMLFSFEPYAKALLRIGNDVHSQSRPQALKRSGSESFVNVRFDTQRLVLCLDEKLKRSDEASHTERLRSRIELAYRPRSGFEMRVRYEHIGASEEEPARTSSQSELLRFDFTFEKGDLRIQTGIYAFTVEDYAARIYQFEPGLPYYPTMQVLRSDGSRWYVRLSYRHQRIGRFALKFDRTSYEESSETKNLLFYYGLK